MIKLATLFWLFLVSATGFAMFGVKYEVQALEDELTRTKRAVAAELHEIHVLDAEWAYLTQPETLEEMNRRHLSLAPIATTQLHATIDDIPIRPQPPPPSATLAIEGQLSESDPAVSPVLHASPAPPAVPIASEKSAQMSEIIKPLPAKAIAKPTPPHPPKTLEDLIAQVVSAR